MNKPTFPKSCPLCGGEVEVRQEEIVVRGGNHAVVFVAWVGVCNRCGERLYTADVTEKQFRLKQQLEAGDIQGLKQVGQLFTLAV